MVEKGLRRLIFRYVSYRRMEFDDGIFVLSHTFSYPSRGEVMYYFRTDCAHAGLMARSLGTGTYCIAALSLPHFRLH